MGLAGGKSRVSVEADEGVGDAVYRFEGAFMFQFGDFDGDVEPLFCVQEGLIAGSFGNSNIGYTIISRVNYIKLVIFD